MAKAFVVIKNGTTVVDRVNSKQDAELVARAMRDANPRAFFEFGKLDKKLYSSESDPTFTPVEEDL